jgi:hypothetical protein
MNWRFLGCALLAAGAFIGLGLLALSMAIGRPGCPSTVVWDARAYVAVGTPTDDPVVGDGQPVLLGSTLVGALSRDVYGPQGSTSADRPAEIALACGDETFQSYVFSESLPTIRPSP